MRSFLTKSKNIVLQVVELCFPGTASRVSGVKLTTLAEDSMEMHRMAFPKRPYPLGSAEDTALPNPGEYHYRSGEDKEVHMNDPRAIQLLQQAVRDNDQQAYDDYAALMLTLTQQCTVRGMMTFKTDSSVHPIHLDQVLTLTLSLNLSPNPKP